MTLRVGQTHPKSQNSVCNHDDCPLLLVRHIDSEHLQKTENGVDRYNDLRL